MTGSEVAVFGYYTCLSLPSSPNISSIAYSATWRTGQIRAQRPSKQKPSETGCWPPMGPARQQSCSHPGGLAVSGCRLKGPHTMGSSQERDD